MSGEESPILIPENENESRENALQLEENDDVGWEEENLWVAVQSPNQDEDQALLTDNNTADEESSLYTNTIIDLDQFENDPKFDLLKQIISNVVNGNNETTTTTTSFEVLLDEGDSNESSDESAENASNIDILNQLILPNVLPASYQDSNALTSNAISSTILEAPEGYAFPITNMNSCTDLIDPIDAAASFFTPTNINNIENQLLSSESDNLFSCAMCCKLFATSYELTNHLQAYHTGEKPFCCEFCETSFKRITELECHYLTHTDSGAFSCYLCNWKFSTETALQNHLLFHTDKKTIPMCEICGDKYAELADLKAHLKGHAEKIILPESLGDLPLNLLQQCNIYTCESCEEQFTNLKTLRRHERFDHKNERKQFPCKYCEKSFARKYKLNEHMMTHNDDKPYACRTCNKGFSSNTNLRTHQMIHAVNKPFICYLCPKGFARKVSLTAHLLTHTGETPFKCDVCGKGFRVKNHLNSHKLIHSTDKPFECDKCFKSFKRGDHLKKHLVTHTDDKPFVCDVCLKGFNRKHNLKIHRATHNRKNNENKVATKLCRKEMNNFNENSSSGSVEDYNTDVDSIDLWEFSNGTLNCYKNPLELEDSIHRDLNEI